MDIITTALSTTVASIAIVVTSIFGVNTANANTNVAPSTSSTTIYESSNVSEREGFVSTGKPVTVCASGGLVPENAPKCPTGK